jgi:hypothetical protein
MTSAARRNMSMCLALLLLSAGSACSGTPPFDLSGEGGAGTAAPGPESGTSDHDAASGTGDDGGQGQLPDATAGADAPASSPPIAGDSAAGSSPEAAVGEAGAWTDAGPGDDSSAGGDDSSSAGTIPCGNAVCTLPAEFCCVTANQGTQMQACDMNQAGCMGQGGSPVRCTSSTQCPMGQVCCGSNANNFYSDVSCQPAPCSGSSGGVERVQFCDPQSPGDCPSDAPRCQQSTVLGGFFVCQ